MSSPREAGIEGVGDPPRRSPPGKSRGRGGGRREDRDVKTLKTFEFPENGGGKTQYDWDVILDGKIRELERGKDYTCKETTFATLARKAAKQRGMVVKSAKSDAGIVIQAVKASAEQLKAWEEAEAADEQGTTTE